MSKVLSVGRRLVLAAKSPDPTKLANWYGSHLEWAGWVLGVAKFLLLSKNNGTMVRLKREASLRVGEGAAITNGYVMGLLLGAEDLMMEDMRANLGPMTRTREWKKNACHGIWSAATVYSVSVRVTPLSALATRGGSIVVGFQELREDEARADSRSHHAWINQVRRPGTVANTPGMSEHPATHPFTVSFNVPKSSWAALSHRIGVTGTEYVQMSEKGPEAIDLTKYYCNSDGIPGGPPILRFVASYSDMSSQKAEDTIDLYSADRSLFRLHFTAHVRLEDPISDLSATWKANTSDEELEVQDFQVYRHRPITITDSYPETGADGQYTQEKDKKVHVTGLTTSFDVLPRTIHKGIAIFALPSGLRSEPDNQDEGDYHMVDNV